MNNDMKQQLLNLKLYMNTAKAQCHYAALRDDGKVDKEEQKNLRILDDAIEKFLNYK